MRAIRRLIGILLAAALMLTAYGEVKRNELPIDIPEETPTLSADYPGQEAEPLFAEQFPVEPEPKGRDIMESDEEVILPPKEDREFATKGEAVKFGLKRGFANLFCCWLEVPRNFSYEFTARPMSAIITAPMMAATLTVTRAVNGTVDVVSGGFNGYRSYGSIPTYPWESPWVAKETELF